MSDILIELSEELEQFIADHVKKDTDSGRYLKSLDENKRVDTLIHALEILKNWYE